MVVKFNRADELESTISMDVLPSVEISALHPLTDRKHNFHSLTFIDVRNKQWMTKVPCFNFNFNFHQSKEHWMSPFLSCRIRTLPFFHPRMNGNKGKTIKIKDKYRKTPLNKNNQFHRTASESGKLKFVKTKTENFSAKKEKNKQ